ncbi:hypothetical protein T265_01725 [Opisthorchis viverrini]|uniref:Uncharacterized protein n=1 Tax=Opisthorchis viverrini TaxID=6198 RepID=A0A075A1H8_OPIVI|nr:hypothetical protein T265_01725 [Opisthorchis viverrini]KER32102.1 hypothetical protein T265_01725 [Opisthorchis viverrini]
MAVTVALKEQCQYTSTEHWCLCQNATQNRPAVPSFQCLTAMPPEESKKAGILLGCSSLDRGIREAEVGFEPRTFRTESWKATALSRAFVLPSYKPARFSRAEILPGCPSLDKKSRDAENANSLTGRFLVRTRPLPLPLDFPSTFGQRGSIPALMLPAIGIGVGCRKGATAERFIL